MRRWLSCAALVLGLGCSSSTERLGEGGSASGGGGASAQKDGGGSPGAGRDPGFVECADTRVDAQRGARGSNVVWVVDNSGSMDEEARFVQDNLNRFADTVASGDLVDYRVVLITERDFVQVPDPLGSDAEHFLHVEEDVGSEEPLSDLLARFSDFEDFLLPGVVTHFVVVTDDESEIGASSFVSSMTSKLGSAFRVHSIASPPGEMAPAEPSSPLDFFDDDDDDSGCVGRFGAAAKPGLEHWEAARLTEGLTFSICSEDWSALFGELAKKVGESAAVPCTVELPDAPAGQTLATGLVNVLFTPPGAKTDEALPRVDSALACKTFGGWHYDDPKSPTRILLCPSSCSAAAAGGALEIALGCVTVVQ